MSEQPSTIREWREEVSAIAVQASRLAREVDDCGGAHHAARLIMRLAEAIDAIAAAALSPDEGPQPGDSDVSFGVQA